MADMMIRGQTSNIGRSANGVPVQVRGTLDGTPFSADWLTALAMEGRIFYASDADQNDVVTGQTSFVNTTPTFLLNVPTGSYAMPLYVQLCQAGSVAGDVIQVTIEIDNIAAYSSSGTSETVLSSRTDNPITNSCTVYSNPTATAGYGVGVYNQKLAEDVDPASADAANFDFIWKPATPIFLVGPASLKVFTFAGTTGPSWLWSIAWAELPTL